MTDAYETYRELATRHVVAQSLDKRVLAGGENGVVDSQKARSALEELARGFGLDAAPDYTDNTQVADYVGAVAAGTGDERNGYFKAKRREIVGSVPDGDYAARYLDIKPVETGDKKHDSVVKAHKALAKYQSLIRGVQEEKVPYSAVVKEVVQGVKDGIEAQLKSREHGAYLPEKTRKLILKVAERKLGRDPNYGIALLGLRVKELEGEIQKDLPDEAAKAKYVKASMGSMKDSEVQKIVDGFFLKEE